MITRLNLLFCLCTLLSAQQDQESVVEELGEPDELRYETELINQLHQIPTDLDIAYADSLSGAQSPWQFSLGKAVLRQRIQYSPSLQGWRMMNKGWVKGDFLDVTFVLEQDPGEKRSNDHAAFSVATDRLQGIDQVLLGNFVVRAGSGMLFSPGYSRLSILPGSLTTRLRPRATAHYSTRENGYLQGIAASWQRDGMDIVAYGSGRQLLGRWRESGFAEDLTGIHPVSKSYATKLHREFGLLMLYYDQGTFYYVGSKITKGMEMELGYQWEHDNQKIQLFIVLGAGYKRLVADWAVRMELLRVSIQLRHYEENDRGTSAPLRLISQNGSGETAYALRIQTNPRKFLRLHFSLDGGLPSYINSLVDLQHIQQFSLMAILKARERKLQVQLSSKKRYPMYPDDLWSGSRIDWKVNKLSLSYSHQLHQSLRYRANIKVAQSGHQRSALLQQRLQWSPVRSYRINLGYSRYLVPDSRLNLTTYETGLIESYSFFSAYGDGQRWYLLVRCEPFRSSIIEFRVAQTQKFQETFTSIPPAFGFQLSIVL
ncbi:MAG: hypothetical protein K9M49_07815 [Candidatus Marinimicrobia bacterium]|nr:hypothetical protein [Candidatus Neomarinimicrobiota bacterium]